MDLTKRRVIARPPTGGGPGRATWSPDGTRLYVSDAAREDASSILSAASGDAAAHGEARGHARARSSSSPGWRC